MVLLVLCVPDSHLLEQSEIFSKDVVRPGLDLLSVLLYSPRVLIIQPRLTPWEEVQTHFQEPLRRELVHNGLRLQCDLCILQVGIEISDQGRLAL